MAARKPADLRNRGSEWAPITYFDGHLDARGSTPWLKAVHCADTCMLCVLTNLTTLPLNGELRTAYRHGFMAPDQPTRVHV